MDPLIWLACGKEWRALLTPFAYLVIDRRQQNASKKF
jgi:hypothetical protein